MPFDLAKQTRLFHSPLRRHAIVESIVDASIELIQIHSLQAVLDALVLRLAALNGLFLLTPLISMACL
ncbi:hypothetical protein [Mesorhizobium onobrychidis]|uniref:Uncharacterized protein n=1 Tax=Mesorhizobium onobrychidis TaxID=2775404 RepID=A0ABY5QTS9_9HYPH|nr:hypothetical protein [Mesorhizobium onobrychidis]UVC14590.1 hypothetical protein IHQ72_28830 [Mesorhizobium onobrychidis]